MLVQDYHLALVPAHAPRAPPRPADRPLLAHPVGAAGLLPAAAGRHRRGGAAGHPRRGPGRLPDPALGGRLRRVLRATCWAPRSPRTADGAGGDAPTGGRPGSACTGSARTREFLRERAHRPDVDERMAALRGRDRAGPPADRAGRPHRAVEEHRARPARLPPAARRPPRAGASRVVHVAFAYPSRQDLAVVPRVHRGGRPGSPTEINAEFGTAGWQPVLLQVEDDFARSLAAYRLADVALVNPIRDGMNLVAKEVPVVSDNGVRAGAVPRGGRRSRSWARTRSPSTRTTSGPRPRRCNAALTMPEAERAERTKRLAAAATALPPSAVVPGPARRAGGAERGVAHRPRSRRGCVFGPGAASRTPGGLRNGVRRGAPGAGWGRPGWTCHPPLGQRLHVRGQGPQDDAPRRAVHHQVGPRQQFFGDLGGRALPTSSPGRPVRAELLRRRRRRRGRPGRRRRTGRDSASDLAYVRGQGDALVHARRAQLQDQAAGFDASGRAGRPGRRAGRAAPRRRPRGPRRGGCGRRRPAALLLDPGAVPGADAVEEPGQFRADGGHAGVGAGGVDRRR